MLYLFSLTLIIAKLVPPKSFSNPACMIEALYDKYLDSSGICTDSRKVSIDSMFFALKGDKFDANRFAAEALDQGARWAVIDDPAFERDRGTILVPDGLRALQELAVFHRKTLSIPVLGLTGSNGKTTTKELIREVLDTRYRVLATRGNLNNHIGVPLSILSIGPEHEIAVIEMGANRVGDIAQLSSFARPSHGLITNIGKAHIGYFGGLEGVIRGKSELYDFLIKHGGTVFINRNQPILYNMARRFQNPLLYPEKGDYYHCRLLDAEPFVRLLTEGGAVLQSQLIGSYNFENIATALCVGKFFGVSADKAHAAIEAYRPEMNRSQVMKKGEHLLILDAYNANPSSMEQALQSLLAMDTTNKAAILGDMYELGDDSREEHFRIGHWLQSSPIQTILLCGEEMSAAQEACPRARHFRTRDDLAAYLNSNRLPASTILIKASRGMALEEIVNFIQ